MRMKLTAILCILLVLAALASAQGNGFILRGTLASAASDGTHYFNVGEALVIMVPKNSALAPNLQNLVGQRVVITVLKDEGGVTFGRR